MSTRARLVWANIAYWLGLIGVIILAFSYIGNQPGEEEVSWIVVGMIVGVFFLLAIGGGLTLRRMDRQSYLSEPR